MQNRNMTSRRFQAEETHRKIYNTAFDLMTRKGFDKITIKDISKKAGVSIGTFYHYYKSKNDILREVYQKADDYFRDVMADMRPGSTVGANRRIFPVLCEIFGAEHRRVYNPPV